MDPFLLTILLFLLLLTFGYGAQKLKIREIYNPDRVRKYELTDFGLDGQEMDFMAEDAVRLSGVWFPADGAVGTLIFCHGKNGNNTGRFPFIADLQQRMAINVFIFDYRGFGKSSRWPTETGIYRDARAAFEVVRAMHDDADAPPVVVFGRSLGAAIAAQLCLDKPARGLIIENGFTDLLSMARRVHPDWPIRWLLRERYETAAKLQVLNLPCMITHSRNDELIPFEMGQELFAAAPEPKQFLETTGGHNDYGWMTDAHIWPQMETFIERCFAGYD